MPRAQQVSGQIIQISSFTSGSDVNSRHWFLVSGEAQSVIDFLELNKIPQSNVKQFVTTDGTEWHAWYHK